MLGFGGGVSFNVEDIPDLTGKVALVTGGNGGIGAETVKQLAAHNCTKIYLASRTHKTAESTTAEIKSAIPNANIILLELDLGSFDSIKAAAETVNAQTDRLDLLVCNAGIAMCSPGLTQSGYEVQFGTNYLGHALLVQLLLSTMLNTAKQGGDVRIILVSSDAHSAFVANGEVGLQTVKTEQTQYNTMRRYGMSKLAMNLFGKEMARRYPTIKTVMVHPGAVFTGIGRGLQKDHPWLVDYLFTPLGSLLFKTPAQGAKNQLWAAVADNVVSGEYYVPVGKGGAASKATNDETKAKELWEWTEKELKSSGFSAEV